MLCGLPPFRAKSRNQLQQLITTGKPKYPKFLSSDALSILKVRDALGWHNPFGFHGMSAPSCFHATALTDPAFPPCRSSQGLLNRDPAKRLGSGPTGVQEIKSHAFFKSINWNKLERREIESGFKPSVKCSRSVENFDKIWTDQKPEDSPCGTPTNAAADSAFSGFSYVSPSFMLTHAGRASLPTP